MCTMKNNQETSDKMLRQVISINQGKMQTFYLEKNIWIRFDIFSITSSQFWVAFLSTVFERS